MLLPLASAWSDPTATGLVCFNATGNGTIYPRASYSPWTVFDVKLPKNGTFWDGNLYADGFNFFMYTQSGGNVYVAVPALNATNSQRYCIYSGGYDNEGLNSGVASILYNNAQGSWSSYGNATYGEYLTVNSPSSTAATSYQLANYSNYGWYVKSRLNASRIGAVNSYVGAGPSQGWAFCSQGCNLLYPNGTWILNTRTIYQDAGIGSWRITETIINSSAFNGTIYDENMTLLGTNGTTASSNTQYAVATARNGTVQMDWLFLGRVSSSAFAPNVTDIIYESVSPNITFVSPAWGSSFTSDDYIPIDIRFDSNFSECNLSLDGTVLDTYNPISPGNVVTTMFDMGTAESGENEFVVNCTYDDTAYYHKYHHINRAGSTSNAVFEQAFGLTPVEMGCPANATVELEHCFEGYNISTQIDFAAVVCTNLNITGGFNYSCLGTNNVTKNGYTIFTRPDTEYLYPGVAGAPTLNRPHVGADFVYYGSALDVGFEIIHTNTTGTNNSYFVYIPAQNKSRDCSIYYFNTSFCSWGYGFTLNNASLFLSDRSNNWFTAGSNGIVDYNYNYSLLVPTQPVYTIIAPSNDVFPNGIYTRMNCFVNNMNQTYELRVKNTVRQNYTINVTYEAYPAWTDTIESFSYYRSVNLTEHGTIEQIILTDSNDDIICQYSGNQNLLLPFVLPNIIPASFEIIVWAMMIFFTVLTSIVPFAALLMILWNDAYHVLNISQISLICMLSIVFGFVNSSFNMERGIKHMLIILGIATAYLSAIAPYADDEGVDISGFDGVIMSFDSLRTSTDIGSFVAGIPMFVINLFILILTLPFTFVSFVLAMLKLISLPLWQAAQAIAPFLTLGFVLYFYIKAYEVLSNRFRPV